jgi:hypothetical protein
MKPTRAAWMFAAGMAWLVLQAILVHAVPMLRYEHAAKHGGLSLVVPLISVVAIGTVPLFFLSFLFHHPFGQRRFLRVVTVVAAVASLLSFAMVVLAFVATAGGHGLTEMEIISSAPWLNQAVPLVIVTSVVLFLAVFARQSGSKASLRRAALVGAFGTLISMIMIIAWVIHSQVEGAFPWYPGVSQSLVAKILGLTAAGALLWFLEAFAVSYGETDEVSDGA